MTEQLPHEHFDKQQKKAKKIQKALEDAARTLMASKESIVTTLLNENVDIDIIMHATKLTEAQILEIKQKYGG